MKVLKAVMMVGLMVSSLGFANVVAPNAYECTGDQAHVLYSTTSLRGEPNISFNVDGVENLNFAGDEITTLDTMIGTIVSINDPRVADAYINYSLILPKVLLNSQVTTVSFDAMVVRTTGAMSGIVLPGQQEGNTYFPVTCTAAVYNF